MYPVDTSLFSIVKSIDVVGTELNNDLKMISEWAFQ